jgi:two-component system sensor histidine kinase DesK
MEVGAGEDEQMAVDPDAPTDRSRPSHDAEATDRPQPTYNAGPIGCSAPMGSLHAGATYRADGSYNTDFTEPTGFGSLGRRNRLVWQFISLIWLTVLISPVAELESSSYPVAGKIALTAVALAFVAGYVLVLRAIRQPPTRRTYAGIALMAALLVILAVVVNWGWLNAMVFVSVSIGMRVPTQRAVQAVLGLSVATVVLAAALGADGDSIYAIGLTMFAVGFMSVGIRRIIEVNIELHRAREDLAGLAVAEERDRFARDLHDLLGHSLSVIALKSEVGQRLAATDPARAADELREIEVVARDALREVREAVGGYHRPTLATEVAGARDALTGAGIDVDARIRTDGLRPDVEAVLAWAVREGATNVLRHSRARHCTIHVGVDTDDRAAVVSVVDDGLGAAAPRQSGPGGAGLTGLAERASAVGGSLESGPRQHGGFALRLSVPLGAVA